MNNYGVEVQLQGFLTSPRNDGDDDDVPNSQTGCCIARRMISCVYCTGAWVVPTAGPSALHTIKISPLAGT